jgi:hypothetical protein
MLKINLVLILLFASISVNAQNWVLKDIGVGLLVMDANYDKTLNIAQRGTTWDMNELYANGAFSGRSDGTKALAAWIQGPHTDTYKNQYGIPVWYYKYKVTYPDGSTIDRGPYGFYTPGFAYATLDYGKKGPNKYKIEFYIVHRDTQETRLVGSVEFTAIYDK